MPHRAPRPCRRVGCPEVVTSKDGFCAIHRSEANKQYNDERRPPRHQLYGSLRWKRLRLAHLTENPFCVRCGEFATVAHHTVEHDGDPILFYNPGNLESLCVACHNRVHERGSARMAGAVSNSGTLND